MNAGAVAEWLSAVEDPELGIDIVSLGLVYAIDFAGERAAITLTTTSPSCPMGSAIVQAAWRHVAERMPGWSVDVEVVHEPRWNVDMMTPMARMALGLPPSVSSSAGAR